MAASVYVGIDVSKGRLDGDLAPAPAPFQAANDAAGIAAVLARLAPLAPPLVVLEATGGLEVALAAALALAEIPVAVVDPRQVRDFAKALGRRARPTPSTRPPWPCSASASGPRRGRCPTRRPAPSRRC